MIKNPNWQEATSWLFTKRGRVESGTTGNKSKQEVRTGFEPGAATCKPNTPTTAPGRLPSHLPWLVFTDVNWRKGDSLILAA